VIKGLLTAVDFQVISTTDEEVKLKLMEAVASINEASRVHSFEDMIERPEVFSGSVFALEETFIVTAETQEEVVGFKLDRIKFGFDDAQLYCPGGSYGQRRHRRIQSRFVP
jgi:hypothetical protein